jgi:hypothetical protein
MSHGRAFALAVAGAALLVALPAAADTSPTPVTPVAPAPVAPAPAYPPGAYPAAPPAAYPPGAYPPGAYPPGAYPPGAYPPGAYPPGAYPGAYPPPPGYYAPAPPLGPYYAPPGTFVMPPPVERRSTGAMVGGIIGVSLGAVLLIAALFEATLADTCNVYDSTGDVACGGNSTAAIGLTVGGLVGIGVGIPLIIYGAKKVPVGTALTNGVPSPLPAWAGTPGGTGWKWQF